MGRGMNGMSARMTENRDNERRRALRALIVEDDLAVHNLFKVVL